MQITLVNFGGCKGSHHKTFESQTLPNGAGKTTLINAYVFALSGRTLNGFEPRNIDPDAGSQTSVTLHHFIGMPPIRRVLKDSGTELYVGEDIATQTDFVSVLKQRGFDLDFILACANANVLTSNGLDAETLRKILTKADVLDSDERDALKKKRTETNKRLDVAKQHALTNITIPERTIGALTEAERVFASAYKEARQIVNDGVVSECPHCGVKYDDQTVNSLTLKYNAAEEHVKASLKEFARITVKHASYEDETQLIGAAQRLLDGATLARANVIKLTKELADIDAELRTLDQQAVAAHLPEGVTVVTEIVQKNGATKPTCTLEYNGIALRSINHAKRIEICVDILDHARAIKGMQDVPIVIDNAEAVNHDFDYINNVILFKAKKAE